MDLQKKIIAEVMRDHGRPTLKELSKLTGIQITRLFRILNGNPMKLNEYLLFQKCLTVESSYYNQLLSPKRLTSSLNKMNQFLEAVGEKGRCELELFMEMRLRHLNILGVGGVV